MKKFLTVTVAALSCGFTGGLSGPSRNIGKLQALGAAKSYLSTGGFSRAGLINQLTSSYGDGFSKAEAVWGVDHAYANWNAEAVEACQVVPEDRALLPGQSDPAA